MLALDKIITLEDQGLVVRAVRYADGEELDIVFADDLEGVVAVETVDLADYEANGFDADGLPGTWRKF